MSGMSMLGKLDPLTALVHKKIGFKSSPFLDQEEESVTPTPAPATRVSDETFNKRGEAMLSGSKRRFNQRRRRQAGTIMQPQPSSTTLG